MSSEPQKLDRLIDEALQDLTAGTPREGLRGRVLARLSASPEPVPIRVFEVFGRRVRPFQLAAVGAVAAFGLVVMLVAPALFQTGGSKTPVDTTTANVPAAPAQASPGPAAPARQVQAAALPAQLQSRRAAVQRVASASPTRAAEEEPGPIPSVKVDPLPDPIPIVNRAIEIRAVEIQPLVIPEIEVPPLDAGRKTADNK